MIAAIRTGAYAALALAASGMAATSADAAPTVLWRAGTHALTVACILPHDMGAVFTLSDGVHQTQLSLEDGYCRTSAVIWRGPQGADAPAALALIDEDGSAGVVDFVAASFDPAPHLQAISHEHGDAGNHPPIPAGQPFRFDFAIEVSSPFGGSNADSVTSPIAMTWRGGTFAIDTPALASRVFTPLDLAFREEVISRDIQRWLTLDNGRVAIGLPLPTKALLDLIASGRADLARRMLDAALRNVPFDRDAYWNDLSAIVVENATHTPALEGHLPRWSLLKAAAAKGDPGRNPDAYKLSKIP